MKSNFIMKSAVLFSFLLIFFTLVEGQATVHRLTDVGCSFQNSLCSWYSKGGTKDFQWVLSAKEESDVPSPRNNHGYLFLFSNGSNEGMDILWSPRFYTNADLIILTLNVFCTQDVDQFIRLYRCDEEVCPDLAEFIDFDCYDENNWNYAQNITLKSGVSKSTQYFWITLSGSSPPLAISDVSLSIDNDLSYSSTTNEGNHTTLTLTSENYTKHNVDQSTNSATRDLTFSSTDTQNYSPSTFSLNIASTTNSLTSDWKTVSLSTKDPKQNVSLRTEIYTVTASTDEDDGQNSTLTDSMTSTSMTLPSQTNEYSTSNLTFTILTEEDFKSNTTLSPNYDTTTVSILTVTSNDNYASKSTVPMTDDGNYTPNSILPVTDDYTPNSSFSLTTDENYTLNSTSKLISDEDSTPHSKFTETTEEEYASNSTLSATTEKDYTSNSTTTLITEEIYTPNSTFTLSTEEDYMSNSTSTFTIEDYTLNLTFTLTTDKSSSSQSTITITDEVFNSNSTSTVTTVEDYMPNSTFTVTTEEDYVPVYGISEIRCTFHDSFCSWFSKGGTKIQWTLSTVEESVIPPTKNGKGHIFLYSNGSDEGMDILWSQQFHVKADVITLTLNVFCTQNIGHFIRLHRCDEDMCPEVVEFINFECYDKNNWNYAQNITLETGVNNSTKYFWITISGFNPPLAISDLFIDAYFTTSVTNTDIRTTLSSASDWIDNNITSSMDISTSLAPENRNFSSTESNYNYSFSTTIQTINSTLSPKISTNNWTVVSQSPNSTFTIATEEYHTLNSTMTNEGMPNSTLTLATSEEYTSNVTSAVVTEDYTPNSTFTVTTEEDYLTVYEISEIGCSFHNSFCYWFSRGGTTIHWTLSAVKENAIPSPENDKGYLFLHSNGNDEGMDILWSQQFYVKSDKITLTLNVFCTQNIDQFILLHRCDEDICSEVAEFIDFECYDKNAWNYAQNITLETGVNNSTKYFLITISGSNPPLAISDVNLSIDTDFTSSTTDFRTTLSSTNDWIDDNTTNITDLPTYEVTLSSNENSPITSIFSITTDGGYTPNSTVTMVTFGNYTSNLTLTVITEKDEDHTLNSTLSITTDENYITNSTLTMTTDENSTVNSKFTTTNDSSFSPKSTITLTTDKFFTPNSTFSLTTEKDDVTVYEIAELGCSFDGTFCSWFSKGGTNIRWALSTIEESNIPSIENGKGHIFLYSNGSDEGMDILWSQEFYVKSDVITLTLNVFCTQNIDQFILLHRCDKDMCPEVAEFIDFECYDKNTWNYATNITLDTGVNNSTQYFWITISGSSPPLAISDINLSTYGDFCSSSTTNTNNSTTISFTSRWIDNNTTPSMNLNTSRTTENHKFSSTESMFNYSFSTSSQNINSASSTDSSTNNWTITSQSTANPVQNISLGTEKTTKTTSTDEDYENNSTITDQTNDRITSTLEFTSQTDANYATNSTITSPAENASSTTVPLNNISTRASTFTATSDEDYRQTSTVTAKTIFHVTTSSVFTLQSDTDYTENSTFTSHTDKQSKTTASLNDNSITKISTISSTSFVMSSTDSETSETNDVMSKETASTSETTSSTSRATSSTSPATSSTSEVIFSTLEATSSTSEAISSTSETTSSTSGTTSSTSGATSSTSEVIFSTLEATSSTSEAIPSTSETTSSTSGTTSSISRTTPSISRSTPSISRSTPSTSEAIPTSKEIASTLNYLVDDTRKSHLFSSWQNTIVGFAVFVMLGVLCVFVIKTGRRVNKIRERWEVAKSRKESVIFDEVGPMPVVMRIISHND